MSRLLPRLASLRLTIGLLIALALLGAVGTTVPQGLAPSEYALRYPGFGSLVPSLGLDRFFSGPLYRGLLAVFTANLLACAIGRSKQAWRNFRGTGAGAARAAPAGHPWPALLRARGFHVAAEAPLHASRRTWAFLGFPLVHLAPPLILAGGLWGGTAGFVATQNVRVGDFTLSAYDWADQADRTLPFALVVEDLRRDYYPLQLQVQVLGPAEPLLIELRVGDATPVPGTPHRLRVADFDPQGGDMTYFVSGPGGDRGPFSRGRETGAPVRARPLAYHDPEIRRAEAVVTLRSPNGEVGARSAVAVNQPLVFAGCRVYLTAWGDDAEGKPFAGFQIVRDPGQPLVWTASVALSFGLFLLLFGDGAWVREEDGALVCRASRGSARARALLAPPAEPPVGRPEDAP